MEISELLKDLRERAGLTQVEAAKGLNVDPQTVSRWERGERRIKAADFERAKAWFFSIIAANDQARMILGPGATTEEIARRFGPSLPADIIDMIRRFEFHAVRLGATNEELEVVHQSLGLAPVIHIVMTGGVDGRSLNLDERRVEFDMIAQALESWLKARIARRPKAAPIAGGFKKMSSKQIAAEKRDAEAAKRTKA